MDEIAAVASQILAFAEGNKVFAFTGEMGTGKTTIIKEICRQLGSHDNFSSPTYNIVNEYKIDGTGGKIYHLDLYRLKNREEALGIGIEDYINGDYYCFIEWPELVANMLPVSTINVRIDIAKNTREIGIFMG